MAFREQEYKERCRICGEEANERCPRCRQNTCKEHRADDLLCRACEQEYVGHERDTLKEGAITLTATRTVDRLFVAVVSVVSVPVVFILTRFSWFQDWYYGKDSLGGSPYLYSIFVFGIALLVWLFLLRRRSQQRLKSWLLARERKRLRVRFISSRDLG